MDPHRLPANEVVVSVKVYEHCTFEELWPLFMQGIATPQDRPLAPEIIVVPGAGWESFFTRRLTETTGCWAHYEFLSLGHWLSRTLTGVLGADRAPARDVDALTWRIAARLPGLLDAPPFEPVRDYLQSSGGADDTGRLIELSRCIAGLFDQYLLLRPDLIAAWEAGADWTGGDPPPPHAEWQRRLFKSVTATHPIRSVRTSIQQLRSSLGAQGGCLPRRVSVWVCGGLPPAQIEFLEVVGRHCDVGLYVVTPSQEYWADMSGRRAVMRRLRDSDLTLRQFCEREHIDLLHPLLASMGRLSQDRQLLLLDRESEDWQSRDVPAAQFDAGSSTSLLGAMQQELRAAREPQAVPHVADSSLTIHSCHSAIREVEVLHDQVRDALEADPKLRSEDIVVLCPDLETYAPLIQAVFGAMEYDRPGHLPFHIAGRSPRRTNPMVEAYFQLLDALQGRLGASDVLDLLNLSPISNAAGFDRAEIEAIAGWVRDAGIRWGLDSAHRRDEHFPESDLNTWQFGLDRLLLGWAMPPAGGQMVGDVLALDRAEGLSGETLGKLWAFVEQLRRWRRDLRDERDWGQWREPLCALAERMLATRDDETGAQKILDSIDRLVNVATDSGFEACLPLAQMSKELGMQVDATAGGAAFRMGGITFCEMAAMRSLPFAVIGMLGMNDGAFPRVDRFVGFDLTVHTSARGDRSARLEDKHLFLEAILSAGRRLIITYQGQGLRDQRMRPPSIAVEELLDSVSPTTDRRRVVTVHPLQAFSPRYFGGEGEDPHLFSYEQTHLLAAGALTRLQSPTPAFLKGALPEETDLVEISVRDLRRLVERPWELVLRRLGASLRDISDAETDRVPLVLDALERWSAGDAWVRQRLAGAPTAAVATTLQRKGSLPGGGLGQTTLAAIRRQAEPVVKNALTRGVTAAPTAVPIQVAVGDTRLVGHVDDFTPAGIRRVTFSNVSEKRMLPLWLDHLLVSAGTDTPAATAILVGRGKSPGVIEIPPVDPAWALQQLETMVQLYRLARCLPLPFFPDSVEAVVKLLNKADPPIDLESDSGASLSVFEARRAFETKPIGTPAAELASVRAAFAGRDPFAMTCLEAPTLGSGDSTLLFVRIFQLICQPMLDVIHRGGRVAD